MGPKSGTCAQDVPLDTQFLLVELSPEDVAESGEYALFLPLVDNGFRASLQGSGSKNNNNHLELICAAESGDAAVTNTGMTALYVAVGDDPFALIKEGMQQVSQKLGTFRTLDEKPLPPFVDEFGWCTWDAFYSKVTPEGILEGVKSLSNVGAPPKTVIIDDGWQQVDPVPPPTEAISKAHEPPNPFQQLVNAIVSPVVEMITSFYDQFVKAAPHDSIPNKIWRFLLPLIKPGLWDFFESETDFARQLSGFQPNDKFENPEQGKSLKGLVEELKADLGVNHVVSCCYSNILLGLSSLSKDLTSPLAIVCVVTKVGLACVTWILEGRIAKVG